MQNPWDSLSQKFKGSTNVAEIDPDVADNILIAWPTILEQIEKHYNGSKDISIIDYGCGTGTFCDILFSLGYDQILGVDASVEMIEVAKQQFGDRINFMHADAVINPLFFNVDVVISIMALQFIQDIQKALTVLVGVVKQKGLLIFAVHNPVTVTASLQAHNGLFSNFQSVDSPTHGNINLGAVSIPIYIRTAAEYDNSMKELGMNKVFELYPPFTKEFLAQFPTETPEVPHFMILGYTKS